MESYRVCIRGFCSRKVVAAKLIRAVVKPIAVQDFLEASVGLFHNAILMHVVAVLGLQYVAGPYLITAESALRSPLSGAVLSAQAGLHPDLVGTAVHYRRKYNWGLQNTVSC